MATTECSPGSPKFFASAETRVASSPSESKMKKTTPPRNSVAQSVSLLFVAHARFDGLIAEYASMAEPHSADDLSMATTSPPWCWLPCGRDKTRSCVMGSHMYHITLDSVLHINDLRH